MIIIMDPKANVAQISQVLKAVEELGFQPRPSRGKDGTVIGVMGAGENALLRGLTSMDGVAEVTTMNTPFKLSAREYRPESTIVELSGGQLGGDDFIVMAGPCSVESHDQLFDAARAVRDSGAVVLRGGAFKPRTSPYSFMGLGEEGLRLMLAAKRELGLDIVTEAMAPDQVDLVAKYADIIQIGARNMQNYALLEAVGKVRKPVMLKRGMMSTVEELLLAAEYIMSNGNQQVILCERGIRTFEKATRNTCDISAVPVLKDKTHLPVVVDPSHAVGVREYIPAVARAAVAAGADGIIVEVHCNPAEALSDGPQALTPPMFAELMETIRPIAAAVGRKMADPK
jgi:3-deoxy-7-phosphoheptulonate synthase